MITSDWLIWFIGTHIILLSNCGNSIMSEILKRWVFSAMWLFGDCSPLLMKCQKFFQDVQNKTKSIYNLSKVWSGDLCFISLNLFWVKSFIPGWNAGYSISITTAKQCGVLRHPVVPFYITIVQNNGSNIKTTLTEMFNIISWLKTSWYMGIYLT